MGANVIPVSDIGVSYSMAILFWALATQRHVNKNASHEATSAQGSAGKSQLLRRQASGSRITAGIMTVSRNHGE